MNINVRWGTGVFLFLSAVFVMIILLPFDAAAQIIIKERMELGKRQVPSIKNTSRSKLMKGISTSSSNPGEAMFIADRKGMLTIYFDQHMRYLNPLTDDHKLRVWVTNGARKIETEIKLLDYYNPPLKTPLSQSCKEDYYVYGQGPFSYFREFNHTDKFDVTVRDDVRNPEVADRSYFSDERPYFEIRYHKYRSWDGEYFLRARSFLHFDVPRGGSGGVVDRAFLRVFVRNAPGGNFRLRQVAGPWTFENITWNNQPPVKEGFQLQKGNAYDGWTHSYPYFRLDMAPFIEDWFKHPDQNFGIRLSIDEFRTREASKGFSFFGSNYRGQYYPRISNHLFVRFLNPAWHPRKLFKVGEVMEGDTVRVVYQNEQPANNYVRLPRRFYKKEIKGKIYEGRRIYFFNENFSGYCRDSYTDTERLDLFAFVQQEELEIALEVPEPGELWPAIPRGGADASFDFSQVENAIEEVLVTVTQGEEPVEGQPVTITAEWVPDSGGHDHNGNDDVQSPPQNQMGWIVHLEEADSARGALVAVTNAEGKIRLRYGAPEFGGDINLIAKTINAGGDTLRAEDELTVRVPGLVPLSSGMHYKKVGGTPSHHGPRLDTKNAFYLTPDNNHYGTEAFVDSLIALATTWNGVVLQDSTQDDRQVPLNINDMSLSHGGKFDIEGAFLNRAEKHAYHRVGRDTDIRTTRNLPMSPAVRNGVLLKPLLDGNGDPILDEKKKKIYRNLEFERVCEKKGANPTPRIHSPNSDEEHYHIYFYN